jgi:hypothetical protein
MPQGIRAELKGCRGLSAGERAQLESDVVHRLTLDLKGGGGPAAAYAHWLKCQSAGRGMPIDDLTACMRWESALAKAECAVLTGVRADVGQQPFFILHLE